LLYLINDEQEYLLGMKNDYISFEPTSKQTAQNEDKVSIKMKIGQAINQKFNLNWRKTKWQDALDLLD
jgi:hypothetical protein